MRFKLILGGVSTSIIALSIVAFVAFFMTQDAISDTALSRLNAIAMNQHRQIITLLDTYQEDLDGISGDTQVRRSLRQFLETGAQVERFRLTQMLTEKASVGTTHHSFDLHNLDGKIIASSEQGHVGPSMYDATETMVVIEPGLMVGSEDVMGTPRGLGIQPQGGDGQGGEGGGHVLSPADLRAGAEACQCLRGTGSGGHGDPRGQPL